MIEIWKDVPEFEGMYQVSDMGRIWSMRLKRIMKPCDNGTGYMKIDLCNNSKVTTYVHRIVMLAFTGPSDLDIDHKNRNKKDNRFVNLEYVTCRENQSRAFRHKRTLPVGVWFVDAMRRRPYRAKISVGKRGIHIGYFETAELAAIAYGEKLKQIENGTI